MAENTTPALPRFVLFTIDGKFHAVDTNKSIITALAVGGVPFQFSDVPF